MTGVITTYAALQAALNRLPPPAPGLIRVFRGQNETFDNMTPTALRTPQSRDMIWPIYASRLAEDIARSPRDEDEVGDDLSRVLLWVWAVKQHYGPGTEFLDVTHSPAIAAWFALHKLESAHADAVYGPPGPFDPRTDVVGRHAMLRHTRFEEPAYLYAFDAAEATTIHDLGHGRVFDLAHAPSAFSSSARIQAQQACLLKADADVDGGDLMSFVVPGTPLSIAWPLTGCDAVNGSTNQIFPPASHDDWYARFVSLPLAPDIEASTEVTVFHHPVPVSLYVPAGDGEAADARLLDDLTYRFVTQRPALLYASRIDNGPIPDDDRLWRRFGEATPIFLEGPMMTTVAPVEQMNLQLLPTALSDSAPTRDLVTGASTERVSLTNVFIEISVLDATGWEEIEHRTAGTTVLRAIWLVRDGERFFVTLFSGAAGEEYTIGPVEVRFDEDAGAFQMRGNASLPWRPLLDFADELARPFFKALALVRALSPRWKLSLSAQMSMGGEGGSIISYAGLEWALGEIRTLRSLSEAISRYCVLRMWEDSREPFYGDVGLDSPVRSGSLRLEGQPYAQVDPAELLASVSPELARRDAQPPPVTTG